MSVNIGTVFVTSDYNGNANVIKEDHGTYNFVYNITKYGREYKIITNILIKNKSNKLIYECDFTSSGIFWKKSVSDITLEFELNREQPQNSILDIVLLVPEEGGTKYSDRLRKRYIVSEARKNTDGSIILKFVDEPDSFENNMRKVNRFPFGGKSKKGRRKTKKRKSRRRKYKKY